MAKRGSKARTGTVKTGQAEIDRQLDEQYAQTAVAWWDVRRPEVYFGIKGERTDEQKDLARRFRQEWGNVRGGAVLNGLVDGTYTADQVTDYWGTENFNSLIKAEGYQIEEFTGTADEFGSYLASQWDNISEFLGGTATGPDGTLGSISEDPMQGMGGPKGAERGVSVTADRITQQEYVNAIRAAAEQAGVSIDVDGPQNSQFTLNYGQFDDVALGEYKLTREPSADIGDFLEAGIKAVLSAVVTGGIGGLIQGLATGTGAIAGVSAGIQGAIANLGALAESVVNLPQSIQNVLTSQLNSGAALSFADAASSAESLDSIYKTIDQVMDLTDFIQSELVVSLENPESVINDEEILNTVMTDGVDAGLDIVSSTQDEEEVVSLEADEDLMGTTEEVAVTQELSPEAEVFEGESTRVIDPIGEVGGTVTVTEVDSGDPFFQPETVPDTTPDTVEVEEVGYEITDPEVDLELDPILPEQPTTEETGGGGDSSQESADSSQDAVDSSQDAETTDLEQAIADAVEVTSEDTPATEDDSDIFSDAAEDDESTAVRPFFRIVDGQVFVRDTLGEDFNWVTYEDFTGSTPPDWLPEDDGLYGEHGEPLGEIEQQATGEEAAPPEDDSDDIVINVLSGNSSDVLDVILDGLTSETPDPVITTEDPVVTTEDPVVTTEDPVVSTDTEIGTETETGTDNGDTKVTDGEENGDDNNGNGDNGNGDDGDGGDGDDGGDEGDGGLGLSGGGLFSLEAPSIFEPSYKPLDYDTQLLKPRMFDFIDYNPLRNIR